MTDHFRLLQIDSIIQTSFIHCAESMTKKFIFCKWEYASIPLYFIIGLFTNVIKCNVLKLIGLSCCLCSKNNHWSLLNKAFTYHIESHTLSSCSHFNNTTFKGNIILQTSFAVISIDTITTWQSNVQCDIHLKWKWVVLLRLQIDGLVGQLRQPNTTQECNVFQTNNK